jgi:hypothetical protein
MSLLIRSRGYARQGFKETVRLAQAQVERKGLMPLLFEDALEDQR